MLIAVYTLTPQRDKHIDNMLAEELRKLGHEVVVRAYVYGARESICYEKPDAIIHPMVGGEYKMDTIEKCKEWGIKVIVRRGEAGVTREVFNRLDANRQELITGHWDYSPFVDLELVWGNEFARLLSEEGYMNWTDLRVCGAFAFDPYFANGTPLTQRNRNRPKTMLFATGFSTADSSPDYCETGLPEGSKYHAELHNIHKDARGKWMASIESLCLKFKDQWKFELKVRPGESTKVYEDMVPSCVKVHPEGSASSEVLRNIDLLIHSGSTMAVEAHLLGIPSFNYCNVNPDPIVAGVAPQVETHNELERLIGRVDLDKSNIIRPMLRHLEESLYGPIDGKACKRAAAHIDEHLKRNRVEKNIPDAWPKEAKYFKDDGIHLEQQEGDARWSCPCCRNIFWGEKEGTRNCPYCNMKINRTTITSRKCPRKRTVVASVAK